MASLFRHKASQDPANILVLRSGTIGDFVCCLPALSFLRQRFPGAKICLLTTPSGNPKNWGKDFIAGALILTDSSLVDCRIVFYGDEIKSFKRMFSLRQQIRSLNPELTFIIPQTGERLSSRFKKVIFLRFLGVCSNISGYSLEKSFNLFRKVQFSDGGFDHQVTTALKAVGASVHERVAFPISIPVAVKDRIDQLWKECELQNKHLVIALFPSGKFEHKRWPLENFSSLCKTLATELNASIVVLGGPQDKRIAARLVATCPALLVNLTGKTSLVETAELLRRCDLYIGNDSGPAHIAAAMGTPCVTLFSSILFPGIWEPWGEQNTAIRHRVPCEYCFSEDHCPIGTKECITGITVDEVLAAVKARVANLGNRIRRMAPGRDPRSGVLNRELLT